MPSLIKKLMIIGNNQSLVAIFEHFVTCFTFECLFNKNHYNIEILSVINITPSPIICDFRLIEQ